MSDDEILKNAQYRKGLSIAFFNATNSAIALCTGMNVHEKETLQKVIEIRDFFLEEHKTYYANVIANVGLFNIEESVAKFEQALDMDKLQKVWLSLSEDERREKAIIELKDTLKKKYSEKLDKKE